MFYKRLLNNKKIRKQTAKPALGQAVIMMTGKSIIGMTRICLLSIVKKWSKLPELIVASDGSITTSKIESALSFWPADITVSDWSITKAYHTHKDRQALVNYTDKHVLGKKMAFVLHQAELKPVLWIDSDIIFYNDFVQHIPQYDGIYCAGSEEPSSLYDDRVLKFYNNKLYQKFKFSSGLLAVSGKDIYESFNIENLLISIQAFEHYFTEQTLFAYLASQSAGIIWNMGLVKNFNSDSQQIRPLDTKDVVARHYTANVRHLFWRDAFFRL